MSLSVTEKISADRGRSNSPSWQGPLLLATLGFALVAVYGSFVPFSYRPIGWREAIARFQQVCTVHHGIGSRADFVANILLFVPIGFFGLGALACKPRRVSRWGLAVVVVALCVALSVWLEFSQLWFPIRTTSRLDILAETIGGMLGAVLWLGFGPFLLDWLNRFDTSPDAGVAGSDRRQHRFNMCLSVYVVGMVIYAILPLDLTLAPSQLIDKYQRGRLNLVPFADLSSRGMSLWIEPLRDVILFVPIGMFLALWRAPGRSRIRPAGSALVLGAWFVLAVETVQIVVLSRTASTTDLITGMVGIGIGIGSLSYVFRAHGAYRAGYTVASIDPKSRAVLALGAATVYVLFLFVVFCSPLPRSVESVVRDPAILQARYEGFFAVPFARLYAGSEWNAMNDVLGKLIFFLPLGALLSAAWGTFSVSLRGTPVVFILSVIGVASVALALEACQLFLPAHHADVTDVVLATTGGFFGMMLANRLFASSGRPDGSSVGYP